MYRLGDDMISISTMRPFDWAASSRPCGRSTPPAARRPFIDFGGVRAEGKAAASGSVAKSLLRYAAK
jgi:hypothetical protein